MSKTPKFITFETPVDATLLIACDPQESKIITIQWGVTGVPSLWKKCKLGDLQFKHILTQAHSQLNEYFQGKRAKFDFPVLSEGGTEFQKTIWKLLQEKVEYGSTITYKELAELSGRHSSQGPDYDYHVVRAVGGANAKNRLVLVVPCHRVIGQGNKMTGYSGGVDVKQKLLNLEQKYLSKLFPEKKGSFISNPILAANLLESNNNNSTDNALAEACDEPVSEKDVLGDEVDERPLCKYWPNCYQRNEAHKQKYRHSDGRPMCIYGDKCFRTNPKHLADFVHPKRNPNDDKEAQKKRKVEQ